MAHLLAPQKSKPTLPVFFNVDAAVGAAPAANNREDVLLVQFAFKAISASRLAGVSSEFYTAAMAVQATGTIDQATINAIRAMQSEIKKNKPSKVVDGRITPADSGYGYGSGTYTIVDLNESVQHRHIDIWPRIDRISGCPPELRQMVVRTVQGT